MNSPLIEFLNTAGLIYILIIIAFALVFNFVRIDTKKRR